MVMVMFRVSGMINVKVRVRDSGVTGKCSGGGGNFPGATMNHTLIECCH